MTRNEIYLLLRNKTQFSTHQETKTQNAIYQPRNNDKIRNFLTKKKMKQRNVPIHSERLKMQFTHPENSEIKRQCTH